MMMLDGSQGEGGGQILRTALGLSLVTGQAFTLNKIRAGRAKPGLKRQHLVCVQAAKAIGQAQVEGAQLGSQTLSFTPFTVQSGHYTFRIESAGSTTLVLQTVLPALMQQPTQSTLHITGGTHNPMAPTADFIQHSFIPTIGKIGLKLDMALQQAGFAPQGGGAIEAIIHPWQQRQHLTLNERGKLQQIRVKVVTQNIERRSAEQPVQLLQKRLAAVSDTEILMFKGAVQGIALTVALQYADHTEVFTALGNGKQTPEQLVSPLLREIRLYQAQAGVVGEYLADQLLLPLALGRGGQYTASVISEHTRTQAKMIQQFLPVEIEFDTLTTDCHQITVRV